MRRTQWIRRAEARDVELHVVRGELCAKGQYQLVDLRCMWARAFVRVVRTAASDTVLEVFVGVSTRSIKPSSRFFPNQRLHSKVYLSTQYAALLCHLQFRYPPQCKEGMRRSSAHGNGGKSMQEYAEERDRRRRALV